MKLKFESGKTYSHSTGHSCAFRQWRADSHCNLIHGYALQFELTFGSEKLDERNWVVDFGGLKELKAWLQDKFDHKMALDKNDPQIERLKELEKHDLAEVRIFDGVGAEMFAKHAFDFADELIKRKTEGRCFVESVECMEHGANSAIYRKE